MYLENFGVLQNQLKVEEWFNVSRNKEIRCRFAGIHRNTLDEKFRVVLPAPFRHSNSEEILDGEFIVTPHEYGYLVVTPELIWEEENEDILQHHAENPIKAKQYLRFRHINSAQLRLDKLFRVVLPKGIRENLNFEGNENKQDIVILGTGEKFEIWPEQLHVGDSTALNWMSEISDEFEGKSYRKPK